MKCLLMHLDHNGVSSFPCDTIEAAKDLQHKRPGGMEAIRQSFFYNAAIQDTKRYLVKEQDGDKLAKL